MSETIFSIIKYYYVYKIIIKFNTNCLHPITLFNMLTANSGDMCNVQFSDVAVLPAWRADLMSEVPEAVYCSSHISKSSKEKIKLFFV